MVFRKSVSEVQNDPALRAMGALLALTLATTAATWIYGGVAQWLAVKSEPICWPMLPHCGQWHFWKRSTWNFLFQFYLASALLIIPLFLKKKWVKYGYFSLLFLSIVKFGIIALDYRLRLNQHIMAFWVSLAFFFIPRKRSSLSILVICFYFWAGLLKLNEEWLSGATLYIKPSFLEGFGLRIACTYVVILELVIAWFLLARSSFLRWATFGQLVIFHFFSFKIVGFFYPIMMMSFLMIFPLSWYFAPPNESNTKPILAKERLNFLLTPVRNFLHTWSQSECLGNFSLAGITTLVLFNLTQIYSKGFPGDTALTGEGRLFSLHMFDALSQCEVYADINRKNGTSERVSLKFPLAPRIQCDPIVYLNRARHVCQSEAPFVYFKDLDLTLKSRRTTESTFKTIVEIKNFCSKNIQYSSLKHNDWIN